MKTIDILKHAVLAAAICFSPAMLTAQQQDRLMEQDLPTDELEQQGAQPRLDQQPGQMTGDARARLGAIDEQQIKTQAQETMNQMVRAALAGDVSGYLQGIDAGSRRQLQEQTLTLSPARDFTQRWQERYGEALDATAGKAQLPLTVQAGGGNSVTATFSGDRGMIALQLLRSTDDNRWKISSAQGFNASRIKSELTRATTELNPDTFPWPQNKDDAYTQVAFKFLRPLSTGAASETETEGSMEMEETAGMDITE